MTFALEIQYQSHIITLTGNTLYHHISQIVITLSSRMFLTLMGVLLHDQTIITSSGNYYIIGRLYYIIGQLLHYRVLITLSVGTGRYTI